MEYVKIGNTSLRADFVKELKGKSLSEAKKVFPTIHDSVLLTFAKADKVSKQKEDK